MKKLFASKDCSCKTRIEWTCQNSLARCEMIRVPNLVATLIITFLIFTLGGESAYSQCAGFCLYEPDSPETTIGTKPTGTENREYTTDNFLSEGTAGPDSALLIPN